MTRNKIFCLLILAILCFEATYTQASCIKNCVSCSNSTSCNTCAGGYFYNTIDQTCRPCGVGCKTCTAPTGNQNASVCTVCQDSLTITAQGTCIACNSNCATCSSTPSNCLTCAQGLTFISNICQRNSSCTNNDCVSCVSGSSTKCESCKVGMFLRQDGSCAPCPYPCQGCSFDIDPSQVLQQFADGIQKIKLFIDNHNGYLAQFNRFLAKKKEFYYTVVLAGSNQTLDSFLAGENYSLLGNVSNLKAPNYTLEIADVSSKFVVFVDRSFFKGLVDQLLITIRSDINFSSIHNDNRNSSSNSSNSSNFFGNNTGNMSNVFAAYSSIDWAGLLKSYAVLTGNSTNKTSTQTFNGSILGNNTYNGNTSGISIGSFLNKLYAQKGFKRFFNGTFNQLIGSNPAAYFDFSSAPATCLGCLKGFAFDSTSSICTTCQPNCLNCNQTNCITCAVGFVISNNTQCIPCRFPCATCGPSATTCLSCVEPFSLSSGTCIKCAAACITCQSLNTTKCITCKAPFSKQAKATGECFRCAQDVCVSCSSTNSSVCIQCVDGASLVDGKCQLCTNKCTDCIAATNTTQAQCLACQNGFVVNTTTSKCQPCGRGCTKCSQANPAICVTCKDGNWKTQTGTCMLCQSICTTCTDGKSCSTYKSGSLMFGTEVVKCRPGCDKCDSTNPETCLVCSNQFVLSGTFCVKCAQGCLTCDSTATSTCLTCPTNRVLSGTQCVDCPFNCTACSSLSTCTSCKMGFVLNSGNCVSAKVSCGNNCDDCDTSSGSGTVNCTKCSFSYVLAPTGKCVKCVSSCGASCDASNPTLCTGCPAGFESSAGKCIRCPKQCMTCSNGICSQCDNGFNLVQTDTSVTCVKACNYPCNNCTGDVCLGCSTNYTLLNGVCKPDTTCGGQGCLFCPTGSYKSTGGDCIVCSGNCASCSSDTCYTCVAGFYLNGSSCVACSIGTAVCLDAVTSITCQIGYILPASSISSTDLTSASYSTICVACTSPCLECMMLTTMCTSCINSDYKLNGTTCFKSKVVGVGLRLDKDYETFMQSGDAQTVVDFINNRINATVIITYMGSGSTIINLAASGTGSASEASMAGTISGAVSSENLGIPVLSSSVGVFLDDAPFSQPSSSSDNAGMIAGIVVGVVVFAVIVAIIIYKYKKSKQLASNIAPDSTNEMMNIQNNNGSTNVMYGQPQYSNQGGYYPQQQPNVVVIGSNDKVLYA